MMTMHTPRRPWPLWALGNLAVLALVPAYMLWLQRTAQPSAGAALPTDGDSIGIPMAGVLRILPWLLMILNLVLFWGLRRYPGRVPLGVSRGRAAPAAEVLFGAAILAWAVLLLNSLAYGDWELAAVQLPLLYLVVALRAAVLARGGPRSAAG